MRQKATTETLACSPRTKCSEKSWRKKKKVRKSECKKHICLLLHFSLGGKKRLLWEFLITDLHCAGLIFIFIPQHGLRNSKPKRKRKKFNLKRVVLGAHQETSTQTTQDSHKIWAQNPNKRKQGKIDKNPITQILKSLGLRKYLKPTGEGV